MSIESRRTARDRSWLGRLAGITQIIFGALLGGLATLLGSEPGFLPRGVVLLVAFGLPGVVGIIGATRRRPGLLVAAALTSFGGAVIAFSGVTLIFLIPAVMFAMGAVAIAAAPADAHSGWLASGFAQLLAATCIVALLVAGGAAALLLTDAACWNALEGFGSSLYQMLPYSNGGTIPPGFTEAGCSTGLISARGVGIALALWLVAIRLAVRTSRRGAST